jgi:hypothetical protein
MASKKPAAKKSLFKKTVSKKKSLVKATAKNAVVKKTLIKKAAAQKVAVKKAVVKKTVNKKPSVKKLATKKVVIKKTVNKNKVVKNNSSKTKLASNNSLHIISNAAGQQMTDAFMANLNNIGNIIFNAGIQFDISLFQQLVALPNASHIRVYNAVKTQVAGDSTLLHHTFVIVAVDEKGKTIFLDNGNNNPNTVQAKGENPPPPPAGGDGVGNMGVNCPAY